MPSRLFIQEANYLPTSIKQFAFSLVEILNFHFYHQQKNFSGFSENKGVLWTLYLCGSRFIKQYDETFIYSNFFCQPVLYFSFSFLLKLTRAYPQYNLRAEHTVSKTETNAKI